VIPEDRTPLPQLGERKKCKEPNHSGLGVVVFCCGFVWGWVLVVFGFGKGKRRGFPRNFRRKEREKYEES